MSTEQMANRRYYECRNCHHRLTPSAYRARCPDCGGRLQNLAVPRE